MSIMAKKGIGAQSTAKRGSFYVDRNWAYRFSTLLYRTFCWLLGVSKNAFSVAVADDNTVDQLKETIVKKKPNALANVDPDDLALWEVSIPITNQLEDEISKKKFLEENRLLPGVLLSDIFPPSRLDGKIVESPVSDHGEKHKRGEEEDDPHPIKRLKFELEKGAPPSLAHPEIFKTIVGPERIVGCNRPFETDTIPLALLHPAFGIFKDRCKEPPSPNALSLLNALTDIVCAWHDQEVHLRSKVREMLQSYTDLDFLEQKIAGTEFTTDGNLPVIVMPAAIRECKNEHGDPLNQVILYYMNFLKRAFLSHQYHNIDSRFPCILLIDMGPSFEFYGAIWDGQRVRIELLTPCLNLTTPWMETNAREVIASGFDALVLAVVHIEAHYKNIAAEAKAKPPPSTRSFDKHHQKACGFPFVTSYVVDGEELSFTYTRRLDDSKLVFFATTNQPEPTAHVVKFAKRYSEPAHRLLASYGSAPLLVQCFRVSTDWIAIVMERSSYKVLHGMELTEAEQKKVLEKVKEVVQILHNQGFVHGDIRLSNILVDILVDLSSLASGEVQIHFLDFDWAGRIGEAKYPIGVNRETVRRPEGVEGGKLITAQHDDDMVSYLFV